MSTCIWGAVVSTCIQAWSVKVRVRVSALLFEESGQLHEGDAFAIAAGLCALIALDGLRSAPEVLVATSHRTPHARIVRPQRGRLAVIVEGIVVHGEDLVGLA